MKSDVSFAPRTGAGSPILGGLFALGYPVVLVAVSLSVGFRQGGGIGEFAATLAATVLFLIAAPTAWVFAFPFIDVTRFTVLIVGTLTSAPIWYVLGVALVRASDEWIGWFKRYVVACVLWTAFNLVALGVVAGLA